MTLFIVKSVAGMATDFTINYAIPVFAMPNVIYYNKITELVIRNINTA